MQLGCGAGGEKRSSVQVVNAPQGNSLKIVRLPDWLKIVPSTGWLKIVLFNRSAKNDWFNTVTDCQMYIVHIVLRPFQSFRLESCRLSQQKILFATREGHTWKGKTHLEAIWRSISKRKQMLKEHLFVVTFLIKRLARVSCLSQKYSIWRRCGKRAKWFCPSDGFSPLPLSVALPHLGIWWWWGQAGHFSGTSHTNGEQLGLQWNSLCNPWCFCQDIFAVLGWGWWGRRSCAGMRSARACQHSHGLEYFSSCRWKDKL